MNENPSSNTIFQAALQIADADERAGFLKEACEGNQALLLDVESLLAAYSGAGSFLEPQITPEPATPGEQPGDRIGQYKLLELIGEGGFGRVWMAEQTEPVKRRVALKVIKPGMDSKEVIARFEAERQALALMDHPHIAHVHEAGAAENGRPYFVMELVKGIPLTTYCADRKLGTAERLELFLDVCSAVRHAHQKGIIHRDLKPSNILVSPHDGEPVVKVIDFGIAKAIGMELTDKTVFTQLGRMIGTPQYMSPEQAELNALDVDTRSDIYSLGVVLYELLTGSTPLDAQRLRSAGYEEMQRMIREEQPQKPSTRISELREQSKELTKDRESELRALQSATARELDWIVLKALEKERQRRYHTADSFADDLRRHLADEAVEARPPSALYRWRKIARRHRGGIAAAAAITITLIAGAATSTYLAVIASRDRDAAEREAAISKAVNEFINNDLFGSADPGEEPDRDLKVRTVLDRASASIEGRFGDQPLVEASIRMTLGQTYFGLGEYVEAERHADRSYQLRKRELGDTHQDTLESLNGIAVALLSQGEHAQAIKMGEEVLELCRKALGAEHPDTLGAMSNLAASYCAAGRLDEALKMREEVLPLCRKALGAEHPDTLRAMNNLAASYYAADRRDEAIKMQEEVLELCRKAHGAEHPDTLAAMGNLAFFYSAAGRLDETLKMSEEVLPLCRKALGAEHPRTLGAMNNLAASYCAAGRLDEAIKMQGEVLELCCKALGAEHPKTLGAMNNLAASYYAAGRRDEAVKMREEVSEASREVLGPEHPDTLSAMYNLAVSYSTARRKEEAIKMHEEVLELFRKALGAEHPDTLRAKNNLAASYYAAGRRDEAIKMLEEALDLCWGVLGPDHPDTLMTMENLSTSYNQTAPILKLARMRSEPSEFLRRAGYGPEVEQQALLHKQLTRMAENQTKGPVEEDAIDRYNAEPVPPPLRLPKPEQHHRDNPPVPADLANAAKVAKVFLDHVFAGRVTEAETLMARVAADQSDDNMLADSIKRFSERFGGLRSSRLLRGRCQEFAAGKELEGAAEPRSLWLLYQCETGKEACVAGLWLRQGGIGDPAAWKVGCVGATPLAKDGWTAQEMQLNMAFAVARRAGGAPPGDWKPLLAAAEMEAELLGLALPALPPSTGKADDDLAAAKEWFAHYFGPSVKAGVPVNLQADLIPASPPVMVRKNRSVSGLGIQRMLNWLHGPYTPCFMRLLEQDGRVTLLQPPRAQEGDPFEGLRITAVELHVAGGRKVDEAKLRELVTEKTGDIYTHNRHMDMVTAIGESGLVEGCLSVSAERTEDGVKVTVEVGGEP